MDEGTSKEMRKFSVFDEKWERAQPDVLKSTNVCQAAEESAMINIKNEKYDTGEGTSAVKTDIEEQRQSEDLFPSQPSTENYSVPSASCSPDLDHSAELFHEDDTKEEDEDVEEIFSEEEILPGSQSESESDSDCEEEMSLLNRMPGCSTHLPKLRYSFNHCVLFDVDFQPGDALRPYPRTYCDKWDFHHVRMPCSLANKYPVQDFFGERTIVSRWELVCGNLENYIASSNALEEAIMSYNTQYIGRWNFEGLHAFINKHMNDAERDYFFDVLLPGMKKMALDLPNICTQPIPLLKKGRDRSITMTQKQIGCLLLNAFFCTFPRRNASVPQRQRRARQEHPVEYENYPTINFNRLFFGQNNDIVPKNAEKLKCLLNYFKRITAVDPTGAVTFHRQNIENSKLPNWNASTRGIKTAVVRSSGLIETTGQGMLQVDFANKFVGGGVLSRGCVQEEIRFLICPDLLVSRLFTECLEDNEVLIITGVEQYNKYSGYAETFKWEGDFKDKSPRDSWRRMYTQVVAMDATRFNNTKEQYTPRSLTRELNKAYCGFYEAGSPSLHLPAIATGNWGCGAFRGNSKLKFLVQLMAASAVGRDLLYFTFKDKKLKSDLQNMYKFISEKNLAVGDIWRLLMSYIDHAAR